MNLKKILAVVLSMTLLVSCLVSGMSLNTSATTPDPETDAKANLEAAWAALEYTPVVVHDGFWKKTTTNNGESWSWPGSAAASDSELELADGTKIPAYLVAASTETPSNDEAFIVSDKNSYNRPTSNVPVVAGTKLYFYVSGDAIDKIGAFYCRADEDVSFYPTFTTETITDNVGETWTKYGCTVKSDDDNSLAGKKLGRLQFGASTKIFGRKVSAVLIQDPITVPQENSLLELVKKAENIDLNEIQDGEAKNNFVSALAAAVEVLYTDEANTIGYLTHKWGKMTKNPEVVFENFVEKDGNSWSDKTTNSTDDSNIGANVYTATADKPLIVVTGVYNNPTKWANFNNYDEIYFYYSSPNSDGTFAPDTCTESSEYASGTLGGPTVTLTKTTDSNLVKFDLMTATKNASGYDSANYYATGAEKRAMFRLRFGTVPTNFKISQVFGVKKTVVPDTADKNLGEVIALAKAEDLSTYQNNAAKTEFEAALAKANAIYLSNEDNAKAAIIAAWKKVKNNPEVLFENFYQKSGNSWYNRTDKAIDGIYTPNGTDTGLIIMNAQTTDDATGKSDMNKNMTLFSINDYDKIYLNYSSTAAYKFNATKADKIGNNIGNGVDITMPATSGVMKEFDVKSAMKKASGYSDGIYDGTSGYMLRLHFASIGTDFRVSKLFGVDELDLATAFSDVFDAEGNAKNLTLAQLINAYTKYDFENDYDAAELVAVVEDVKAANPAVRISGDAIFKNGNECFYGNNDGELVTAYRTYAQYTCPIENDEPVLNKVVVDGKAYDLVSRSILIARSADGTFGTLDMSTDGAKWVTTTVENLSAKYWSVADNGDGTATVTYSMLLKDVSKANAEGKYHMTRAMIEYKDGAGNTVQVYSKPREHGTIKETFEHAYENNKNLQWFPQVNN